MKTCIKCGERKRATDFYLHPQMADGRLNQCKECSKRLTREHRAANIEYYRAYDRERAKLPHRKANAVRCASEWRRSDHRRMKCHNAVTRAVRAGLLKKHGCSKCGAPKALAPS